MVRPLVLIAAMALPEPLLACNFALYDPADKVELGEACAATWTLKTDRRVMLSPAVDLGQGMTLQDVRDGHDCGYEFSLIVHDCHSAGVLLVGSEIHSRSRESDEADLAELARHIAEARPTLDEIEVMAAADGHQVIERRISGQQVDVAGFALPTGCACSIFYDGGGG
ncbi:MAG: hypothetical protein JJT81_20105 [Rubellimicrobium sp.]|nr:hypothetical protein [Rubellimicrobium sp.]